MPGSKKAFDCLQFKWQTQERISRDLGKMNWDQEVEYFRKKAEKGPLGSWWKEVKHRRERFHQQGSS